MKFTMKTYQLLRSSRFFALLVIGASFLLLFLNLRIDLRNYVPTALFETTTTKSTPLSAWIVLFTHLKGRPVELQTFFESYEMFQNNKNVYQKILIVWDSAQNDSIEILANLGKIADDIITIDITTETDLNFEAEQFEPKDKRGECANRGSGYCQQLYTKMFVDVFASAAAKKYHLTEPDILGIIDDDTYWHTLPMKENVVDPAGRIIMHTFEPACNHGMKGYEKGVTFMLEADPDSFRNGMLQFPIIIIT